MQLPIGRALLVAAFATVPAGALLPAAAGAATAEVAGGTLAYQAAPGEPNKVRVSVVGSQIVIDDQVAITGRNGCSVDGAGNARCPVTVASVSITLGDDFDSAEYTVPHAGTVSGGEAQDTFFGGARVAAPERAIEPVSYAGGSGSDLVRYDLAAGPVTVRIDNQPFDGRRNGIVSVDRENVQTDVERVTGTRFADVLAGSGSANVLRGGLGGDEVSGNGGNDVFQGEAGADGADRYFGGVGTDRIDVGSRVRGVRLSLDGIADDGEPGEGDNVSGDVEQIRGTDFDDVLVGNDAPNTIFGFVGSDLLEGGGGADTLSAGAGFDTVRGEAGNDLIEARDGIREIVDCGDGNDTANRDALELSVIGCEGGAIGALRLTPATR
jgi:Ca2+-binding RTX toxin-like protein